MSWEGGAPVAMRSLAGIGVWGEWLSWPPALTLSWLVSARESRRGDGSDELGTGRVASSPGADQNGY